MNNYVFVESCENCSRSIDNKFNPENMRCVLCFCYKPRNYDFEFNFQPKKIESHTTTNNTKEIIIEVKSGL